MSPAVSEMLRRLVHFKALAEKRRWDYKNMLLSRDRWRAKAIARRKSLARANRRAQEQHARAELWKHRAMQKEDAA